MAGPMLCLPLKLPAASAPATSSRNSSSESWLNAAVANTDRARVLALYRIIDIGSVTGAQFMIPVFGADGFTIFAIMSMMITLSLVPVSLAARGSVRRSL